MPDEQKKLNEKDKVEELGKSFALHLKSGDNLVITINGVEVNNFIASEGKLSCYWNSKRVN